MFPLTFAVGGSDSRPSLSIIIMDPIPIYSDGDGDIFDCIQTGSIEQCIQFVENDRSILKEQGKLQ